MKKGSTFLGKKNGHEMSPKAPQSDEREENQSSSSKQGISLQKNPHSLCLFAPFFSTFFLRI
jgi:hypothetical protein